MTAAQDPRLVQIADLLQRRAEGRYGLHDVTQREHALQAAWLAEREGCPDSLVVAALLHDIGHLVHGLGEHPAADGVDDRHEAVGDAFLRAWFGVEVCEPVRLHVAAKRYLCAMEPGYHASLAPDSVRSLALQGGPMAPEEAVAFRSLPWAEAAIRLRRFDEAAKPAGLDTPPVAHFLPRVARCLRPHPAAAAG